MIMNKPQSELVPISDLLAALGRWKNPAEKTLRNFIRDNKVVVVAQVARGRGITRFITREQYDEILAKHRPPAGTAPTDDRPDPQLHIIALEKKVADLEAVLKGNTQAINELIKSGNLLCDRLNNVLKQLGAN